MKKRIFSFLMILALLLAGCAPLQDSGDQEDKLTVVATTYPVYLLACAVTQGIEGVQVDRLDTGSTSCLHDYSLTVNDMKKLEGADVIALSGVGLEDFMEDAIAAAKTPVIDCSTGVELLENLSHHHDEEDHSHDVHDHGHFDPHYWMDPDNAQVMLTNLAIGLTALDPDHETLYQDNCSAAQLRLRELDEHLELLCQDARDAGADISGLITFHDGFQYFAHAYHLPLLDSIEEEAGSEASAKEILEISELVQAHTIPVIFTEVNGSDATANAIARETDCQVAQLSMIMDGPGNELDYYIQTQIENMATVINGFAGREVVSLG